MTATPFPFPALYFWFYFFFIYITLFCCHIGVNYQDIGFNGAGLSGSTVSGVGSLGGGAADQLGGLLAPVSVQNLAALAAMTQPPVVTQAAAIQPASAPQQAAPPLCKLLIFICIEASLFLFIISAILWRRYSLV